MNKIVKYRNKCKLNLYSISEVMAMPRDKVIGRRIIGIQENNFFAVGKINEHYDKYYVFFNYPDRKIASLDEILLSKDIDNLDLEKYPEYPEYKKTIETKQSQYEAIKILDVGIKYVVFLDEYKYVIDAEDQPFENGVINLLTYNEDIKYYSRGAVLAVHEECNINEFVGLHFYPKSLINDAHFIELQTYEFFDSVRYLNYYSNFKFFHKDKEIVLI